MATPTQATRHMALATPLGDDVLLLRGFSGTESLSNVFELELDVISEDKAIAFDDIVGQNVSIRLSLPEGGMRCFNGYINRFEQTAPDPEAGFFEYRATMVPWLWFLTQTADCRIFQEKTVPTIIEEVFSELGFTDFEKRLSASYRTWEYCVQYRETDFNFLSRLMEQEGIYYYFKHEDGKHTLVLCDSKSVHEPFPDYDSIDFRPRVDDSEYGQHIEEWIVRQKIQPGKYVHTDYNYEKPKASLLASSEIERQHAQAGAEVFDFPGEFPVKGDGDHYAKVRMEEMAGDFEICNGSGKAQGIAVGHKFSLENHPQSEQNREYLVTSTTIMASGATYETASDGGGSDFSCSLTAIDATVQYRASRKAHKPAVRGVQTAIIVGPGGEEIYTDKYGRVKVQFHWDRYGKADENASCWIRVAQSWAGKKWGAVFMPRIGQEVIVEFIEGDPDRPIITGRVYNDECQPPYLPDHPTKSTIKSLSSKGGGGFNEFRFEDKKGEEQIFIHAEKDHHTRAKNSMYEWIGNEKHLIVKKHDFTKVEEDQHLKVLGNQNAKIDGTISTESGTDMQIKVANNTALETGTELHVKSGLNIVIEAGTAITLKVGGNFINVDQAGLTLKGTMINLNSGGSPGTGSGCTPEAPEEALAAVNADPGQKVAPKKAPKPPTPTVFSPASTVLTQSASEGTPFCEVCEAAGATQEGGGE
jgi:type VI secretion system secreted protein VgrG